MWPLKNNKAAAWQVCPARRALLCSTHFRIRQAQLCSAQTLLHTLGCWFCHPAVQLALAVLPFLSCDCDEQGDASGQGKPLTRRLQGDSSEQGDELHKLRAALRAEKANSVAADMKVRKLQEELAAQGRQQAAALQVAYVAHESPVFRLCFDLRQCHISLSNEAQTDYAVTWQLTLGSCSALPPEASSQCSNSLQPHSAHEAHPGSCLRSLGPEPGGAEAALCSH